jgi:hypothetical protein
MKAWDRKKREQRMGRERIDCAWAQTWADIGSVREEEKPGLAGEIRTDNRMEGEQRV